ncbi:MAG: TetR/AcrR family transcriptional regulator [Polyangiaceae bacterium]
MERILDAAADLFVSNGYDATTTDQIAMKAETSVGSIYQFFPNKRAMFDAIAARHLADASEIFEAFVRVDWRTAPWRELLSRTLDAYASYHRQNQGFRAILLNWKLSPEFLEAGEMLNHEFARRAEAIFEARGVKLTHAERSAAATLAVEATSAVLIRSVRLDDAAAAALFEQLKIMLDRFLSPYLDPPSLDAKKRTKKTSP